MEDAAESVAAADVDSVRFGERLESWP